MWTRQMWHEFAFMSTARGGTIIKLFIECKTILKHKFKVEKNCWQSRSFNKI